VVNRARIKAAVEIERIEKEKVLEIDVMKSRFFANVSHEFRTPLTLLQGPLEELSNNLPYQSGENRNLIQTMKRNLVRIRQLVNQMLDISRLETGQVKVMVEPGNISEFVNTLVQSFLSLAESKKIDYTYQIPDPPYTAYYDRDKLEKILTNLITNALKFTPEGGKVNVGMDFEPGIERGDPIMMKIAVSDTGSGIPVEERERIFERFYQIGHEKRITNEGTGIGLSLTKDLVELYHGTISLESEMGKGSRFIVKLPVLKESFKDDEIIDETLIHDKINRKVSVLPDNPADDGYETEDLAGKENDLPVILVVEDNRDLRNYICRNLKNDYHILQEDNGRKGLHTAVEMIPDLIITDLMMPEMDGMELCKRIREDNRINHVPVIMLTAKADRSSKLKGLEIGADDYLVKPFDPQELQIRTANLVRQRQLLRSRFMHEFRDRTIDDTKAINGDKFLNRVLDILKENVKNPEFNVDRLPAELNMSRSQMFRKIRALTGHGPGDLLRMLRLKKASELLLKDDLNIAQITFEVGMQSPAYFSKMFKAYYRMKPSDYRKALSSK